MGEASGCGRLLGAGGYWVREASGCGRLVGLRGSGRLVGVKNWEDSGCGWFFEIMKKKIFEAKF